MRRSKNRADHAKPPGAGQSSHYRVAGYLLAVLAAVLGLPGSSSAAGGEQLVVFVQADAYANAAAFTSDHLPRLRTAAEEMGLDVRVIDASQGVPPEVRLTPLLVYQDHRGRSTFQARYADVGKLRHFIRTSRAIPPTATTTRRQEIAAVSVGRSLTAAPIKITALAGDLPADHDAQAFLDLAEAAIFTGFEQFEKRAEIELGPSNRLFYMDVYPHRSEAGMLSLSLAIFSQFNCIEPIFQRFEDPVSGPWEQAERVFAEAAAVLEAEVLRQISASPIGDAFQPVGSAVPTVTWADLGLALPPAPTGAADSRVADIELPLRWRIEADDDSGPRLVFRFPAPLERYSGEVRELSGELVLAEDHSLAGATGWLEAATASVTMGESSLDKAIHEKMINVSGFPTSRFDLEEIAGVTLPIAFGRLVPFVAHGSFSLLGLKVPVEVKGEIEPGIGEDGAPCLRVRATYSIRLAQPFGIAGPDGPTPANDTLVFHLNFVMREA